MACKECERRRKELRDLILHGKMAAAMDKTVEGLRYMIGIDASADHRKEVVVTPTPISLTGKTKAELLEIAADQGVFTEDGATNAEIVEAIEAKRAKAG